MATTDQSDTSQTAQDYINSQLSLEADAREVLPYQFDTCTKPFGPLRQSIYACLTCTPPPATKFQQFEPAGVCYSCSISCHGEHTLVELFSKRDFACDCGTSRLENGGTPCSLRVNEQTGSRGNVVNDSPRIGNKYNHNFKGRFCGCGEEYDPETEKGTMFQCIGLGTIDEGGCGEDWWHPDCLMGLPRAQPEEKASVKVEHNEAYNQDSEHSSTALETIQEDIGKDIATAINGDMTSTIADAQDHSDDLPPGFPHEDDFEHLICYKCTAAFPWIKKYAGTPGFLPALHLKANGTVPYSAAHSDADRAQTAGGKRKAEDELVAGQDFKRARSGDVGATTADIEQADALSTDDARMSSASDPRHTSLPPPPDGPISLFLTSTFRENLCRCATCFPLLVPHPALLDEEETYSPPLSETSSVAADGETGANPAATAFATNRSITGRTSSSRGGGSLLDRGEAALSTMDRVRAIEGVMAYNHVRDKVKAFLAPFAESGKAVGAEDVKAYFASLRGDSAVGTGNVNAADDEGGVRGDSRKEGEGY